MTLSNNPERAEAIRRLIELGLAVKESRNEGTNGFTIRRQRCASAMERDGAKGDRCVGRGAGRLAQPFRSHPPPGRARVEGEGEVTGVALAAVSRSTYGARDYRLCFDAAVDLSLAL